MKKQTPNYYGTPHNYRRQAVHSLFLILIGLITLLYAFGCTPVKKTGCEYLYKNKRKFTAWIKHSDSNKVFILDRDGSIICCLPQNSFGKGKEPVKYLSFVNPGSYF